MGGGCVTALLPNTRNLPFEPCGRCKIDMMSADTLGASISQEQSASTMPSTTPIIPREMISAIPPFSYAQAAKGRTPNSLSSPMGDITDSNSIDTETKRTVSSDRRTGTADTDRNSAKRTASEGRIPASRSRVEKNEPELQRLEDKKDEGVPGVSVKQKDEAAQKVMSLPSSPEYGTTSTSTLPKEEDVFSTGNGSSESTWDKQSQSSQNGSKPTEGATPEQQNNPVTSPAWDEEIPTAPAFKEAPPPTLNIWQQRKEAQDAKSKAKQQLTPPTKRSNSNGGQGGLNGVAKAPDATTEAKRTEPRRKGKTVPEEKIGNDTPKGINKIAKVRNSDDGMDHCCKSSTDKQLTRTFADKSPSTAMAAPPPPGDAISWPTPDSAVGEEKKKSQPQQRLDDGEKEKEKEVPKPSGKKGWTHVPFVPTAVFNTPLPQARRGGRGPSGGSRDNPPRNRNNAPGANGGDKPNFGTSAIPNQATTTDKTKPNASSLTLSSTASKPKRSSSAGPSIAKEQRKMGDHPGTEKRKDSSTDESQIGLTKRTGTSEARRPPIVPVPATPQVSRASGRPTNYETLPIATPVIHNSNGNDKESRMIASEALPQPRGTGPERRSEGSIRQSDLPKDFQGNLTGRERGEERPGRGRGGHRGRGGATQATYNAHLPNGHAYSNGQPYQYQPPFSAQARSFSNHERMPSQSQAGLFGLSPPHRTFRSTSRSHYNPGYLPTNGRFSNGPNSGPTHLPSIQTDLANMSAFQPGAQGIMSAIPYNPYEEQVTLFDMVTMQMEYYFSLDNLCKDMFLRKHMDSQGYVFLSVLAGFNRIVALTTDIEMIRYVCFNSQKIELKPGQIWQDGRDRLRAREGWKNFVLSIDQRDPSAQSDGPTPAPSHTSSDSTYGFDDRQGISPRSNPSSDPMEFPYQSLNAIAPSAINATPPNPMTNGTYPDSNPPPLSASVSEFSPSAHSHTSRRFGSPDPRSHETKTFTNEDVQHLQILVRQPINSIYPPFHSASSRTFSNGSIDGRNIGDELSRFAERQPRPVNGDVFERWVHDRLSSSLKQH